MHTSNVSCSKSPTRLKQGSNDPLSLWVLARKNFVLQLLLRLRAVRWEDINNTKPLRCFEANVLGEINLHQIVYWDQTHRQCVVGPAAVCQHVISFPRNKEGKIDVEKGTHIKGPDFVLNVKYPKS